MNPLRIVGTDDTPSVNFAPDEGIFEIAGRSLPEDVVNFYEPVINWLAEYFKDPNVNTEFIFNLNYFNTATSKILLDILVMLDKMNDSGHNVHVTWMYAQDDEDIQDAGEEFRDKIDLPFNIVAC